MTYSLYLDVRVVDEVLPDALQVAGRQDPVGGHRHVLLPLLLHLLLAGPVPVQLEDVVEDVGRGQVDAGAVDLVVLADGDGLDMVAHHGVVERFTK